MSFQKKFRVIKDQPPEYAKGLSQDLATQLSSLQRAIGGEVGQWQDIQQSLIPQALAGGTEQQRQAAQYYQSVLGRTPEYYTGGTDYSAELAKRLAEIENQKRQTMEAATTGGLRYGLTPGSSGQIQKGIVEAALTGNLATEQAKAGIEAEKRAAMQKAIETSTGAEMTAAQGLGQMTLSDILGNLQNLQSLPYQTQMQLAQIINAFKPIYDQIAWVGETGGEGIQSMNQMGGSMLGSCCWNFLAAEDGHLDPVVRRYRDEHMNLRNRRGYYKLAEVFVPLMKKHRWFKQLIRYTMTRPMTHYGRYYYHEKQNWLSRLVARMTSAPIARFWLKLYDFLGQDHPYLREMGELV